MIARTWRGWASPATAEDYQVHYETEVAEHFRRVPGFRGARLLRREDGDEVLFTSIAFFDAMAHVRGFAGEQVDEPVLEEAARRALSRWDDVVEHHEVGVDLAAPVG
jgi:antibiotic biosynthesis monooxygenase (ABM) superfamily enzyme